MGAIHALTLHIINLYCLHENFMIDGDGYTVDNWMFSMHIFTSVILLAEFKISLFTRYWTIFNLIFITFFSFFLYIAYLVVSDYFLYELTNVTPHMLSNQYLYSSIILTAGIVIIFEMCIQITQVEMTLDTVESARR